jgi:NADH:ubiquinone oxidoreductase subunit K
MISPAVLLIFLGLFLFFAGILQCLSSRRFLGYLIGIEMLMNAANLNFTAILLFQPDRTGLQADILLVTALAVIEAAAGLALFGWLSAREKNPEFRIL